MTCSASGHRVAQVRGATVTGLTATLIDVCVTIDSANQGFEIRGAPGYQTWPLRDRVRAAVLNSAMTWPAGGITVELSPGTRFRHSCGLDLAIAVAVLAASGAVPSPAVADRVFIAELGLDGQLRPVRHMMPVLTALAASSGNSVLPTTVIASSNQPDAAEVPGVTVAACRDLQPVTAWLSGERESA